MLSVFEAEEERLKRGEEPNFWFPPPEPVLALVEEGRKAEALEKMLALVAGGAAGGSSKALPLLSMGEFQEYIVKDLQKAIDSYLRALKEHPEEGLPSRASQAPFTVGIWVPIKVAVCLQKMGRHEDAVKYYSRHYPWRMFWFEIAECYARAGNQKKAKEAYRKAGEYHLEDTWGSQPELAFRAFAALGDKDMMQKTVEAVKGKYGPSAAKATLWQMREWAKGARKKEAASIAAEGLERLNEAG